MTHTRHSYSIKLIGLQLFGYHGVLPHEQEYGQEFFIDCRVEVRRPSADDIASTVSYADLADLIEATFKAERFDLIESVADQLLAAVLSHSADISEAEITVHKPSAPLSQKFADVSVTVSGSRG